MKEVYDRSSLLKDISERNQLLQDYQRTGWLDRDKAIRKIRELRATDIKVATAAAMTPARNQIPFDQASDQMIANELQGQLEYLVMKAANQES